MVFLASLDLRYCDLIIPRNTLDTPEDICSLEDKSDFLMSVRLLPRVTRGLPVQGDLQGRE